MSAVEAWAASKGTTDLRLTIWDFNQRAIAFYEELGYQTRSRLIWKPLQTETAAATAYEFRPAQPLR